MGRVLVVGETAPNRRAIVEQLRAQGHQAHGLADVAGLDHAVAQLRPQVVVLDAGLVGSGESPAVQTARGTGRVLLLTKKSDRTSLEPLSADDHLARPYTAPDVAAHVAALLAGPAAPSVTVGDLTIENGGFRVTRAGTVVALTATERKLLGRLALTPGVPVSKGELMSAVWGYDGYGDNLVEVHMSSLRRRLEALGPRLIVTERGRGYRLG
ncbi:winged helix-turn-helix transcriptional regulator [Aestuariimicrobium soli]|uniref:winged helix-turn-helix transcriptional regulator n=1 Tax=Aestuariimicrobium soli TaxID=2035834 RepID=UPI003EC0CE29